MPDVSQVTVKLTTLIIIVCGVIGGTGSAVWLAAAELAAIRIDIRTLKENDIQFLKDNIGSRWRLTDMERWCRETERLNGNKWRCADPFKIVPSKDFGGSEP